MSNYEPGAVYIVSACRSAIGSLNGTLAPYTARQLGAMAVNEAVKQAGIDPIHYNYGYMGQVVQAGSQQNPARFAMVEGGLPDDVPAVTINRVCGSGLLSVSEAATRIMAGRCDVLVAGGMESMTNSPYASFDMRAGARMGNGWMHDLMVHDGLTCPFNLVHMGTIGDWTAEQAGLTREEIDEYAAASYAKALAAQAAGKFDAEIFPITIHQKKGDPIIFEKDEDVRETPLEKLANMWTAFSRVGGFCTAGNSPSVNDGSGAVVVVSGRYLNDHPEVKPMARIVDFAEVAGLPKKLFFMPIFAVRKLMDQMGVDINHFDLIEANEAFSSQSLACAKGLEWDSERVNVNGGAVALGHPIGASGVRVLVTLLYALKDCGLKNGLATLCLGGGGAISMSIEMCE